MGFSCKKKLMQQGVHLPIIFMTEQGSIPMSVSAMKRGTIDFLPKPFKTQDLLNSIREALDRDLHSMKEESQKSKVGSQINTLTPREKEILRWLITGKLNKQIAYDLGITERTVKAHRSRVLEKTRVSSMAILVRLTEQAGISPAD
jgi:FixJ family two-component response regulator